MTRSQLFSPSFLLRSTFWMRKSHWEKSRKEAVFIALHIFLIPSSQCFVMIIPLSTGQRVSSTFSDYSTASHFLWNEQVARHVHHVKASQAPIFMIYYQPSCRLSLVCFTYMSHNLLFKQSFSRNARPGTSYYYYFFSVWSIFPPLFWLQTHEYFQTQSECQPSELLTLHLAVGNKASILLPPLQSLACNCQNVHWTPTTEAHWMTSIFPMKLYPQPSRNRSPSFPHLTVAQESTFYNKKCSVNVCWRTA